MSRPCPPIPDDLLAMLVRMFGQDWPPKLARDTGRGKRTVEQWRQHGYMPAEAQKWVRREFAAKGRQ